MSFSSPQYFSRALMPFFLMSSSNEPVTSRKKKVYTSACSNPNTCGCFFILETSHVLPAALHHHVQVTPTITRDSKYLLVRRRMDSKWTAPGGRKKRKHPRFGSFPKPGDGRSLLSTSKTRAAPKKTGKWQKNKIDMGSS